MAEQRPYRSRGAVLGLQRVKKFAAAVLGASFLTVNWMTTQHAAWLIGDSPRLRTGSICASVDGTNLRTVEVDGMGVALAGNRADEAPVGS